MRDQFLVEVSDSTAAEIAERGLTHAAALLELNALFTARVDEGHLLAADQLEELRLLSNADLDSHSPFACVLVGQPTLRRRIKLGTFAALDQRIALRYAMNGMTDKETASYVAHDAASAVMRRGHLNGPAGKCISTGPSRIIQSCSRNARSSSGGR